MMKLNFVTLENGIDYMIMQEITNGNIKYLYLVNENDENDFCIRKVIIEDNDKMLSALDSEEELKLALDLFKSNSKN